MMLEFFGSERYYEFNPVNYNNFLTMQKHGTPTFPSTVHVIFTPGFLANMSGEQVADLFTDYGDFYCQKATEDSCFIEFFHVNDLVVKDKKYTTFMDMIKQDESLNVVATSMHREAPYFKAHNIIDNK